MHEKEERKKKPDMKNKKGKAEQTKPSNSMMMQHEQTEQLNDENVDLDCLNQIN